MLFNFVISTSERAVKTWRAYGFEVVGALPARSGTPSAASSTRFDTYLA